MDAEVNTERSTVFLAVLSILIVGLGLVLALWQTIQRQEEALREHLLLTSRSVLQAVESSLRRGHFVKPGSELLLSPDTADFFRELEQSGDVIFVSIIDSTGEKILASLPGPVSGEIHFQPDVLEQMVENGVENNRFSSRRSFARGTGRC